MVERLRVVAATANAHKLEEIKAILGDVVELLPRPENLSEVVEDAGTFEGNARLKAVAVASATGEVALADDSGLEVDALGGEPGVESAYYGGGDHDDAANRARLLRDLHDRGATGEGRRGRFRSVVVLRWPDGREIVAEGICPGRIGEAERGEYGFGYDSLFIPDEGDGRSFGEHLPAEKNAYSHRSRACQALLDKLSDGGGQGK